MGQTEEEYLFQREKLKRDFDIPGDPSVANEAVNSGEEWGTRVRGEEELCEFLVALLTARREASLRHWDGSLELHTDCSSQFDLLDIEP